MMMTTAQTVPYSDATVLDISVPAWAWAVVAVAAGAIYMLTLANGAVLGEAATTLHELFHDGRHLASVPCH